MIPSSRPGTPKPSIHRGGSAPGTAPCSGVRRCLALALMRALALALACRAGGAMAGEASVVVLAPSPSPRHAAVEQFERARGEQAYWLFEPRAPMPERAPVVVFLHGWMATNPGIYGAWIDHLVRRGTIVIFPRYQFWASHPSTFLPNAEAAIRDALRVLGTEAGHVRPDLGRFALIGHSAGGDLAVHLTERAGRIGLPEPKAVVLLMPGRVDLTRAPDPAAIPSGTALAVVVADRDRIVGDRVAREVFAGAVQVPTERKCYVVYRSDPRGRPPLIADHLAPVAALAAFDSGEGPIRVTRMPRAAVNTLDRLGLWRLADLTLDAGFTGRSLAEATRQGALLRDLGRWPDGGPIAPPIVASDLAGMPPMPRSLNACFIPRRLDATLGAIDSGTPTGLPAPGSSLDRGRLGARDSSAGEAGAESTATDRGPASNDPGPSIGG